MTRDERTSLSPRGSQEGTVRQRAVLAGLCTKNADPLDFERRLDELERLAETAGAVSVARIVQMRTTPTPQFLFGKGKAAEIGAAALSCGADLVIVQNNLSPAQQRNLESEIDNLVLDRSALILDIFAQHATTRDGKLQVELAQLRYLLPRLTGRGVLLSRLGGGIGTRGPGETKLEMDRRRIRQRIARLNGEVDQIRKVRGQQRSRRRRSQIPVASIVGYTNAGKSTLLNRVTRGGVYAADELFATLDPNTRRLDFAGGGSLLLSDTVGFITDMPRSLEAAFAGTLEEVTYSDFLVHVVDLSSPRIEQEMSAVFAILDRLEVQDQPMLTVFNKRDRVPRVPSELLIRHAPALAISAETGEGVDELLARMSEMGRPPEVELILLLPHSEGRLRSALYDQGEVLEESVQDTGHRLRVRVPQSLSLPLLPFQVE